MARRKWLEIGTKVRFTERAASCVRVVEYDFDFGGRQTADPKDYGTITKPDWKTITDAGRGLLRQLSLSPDGPGFALHFALPERERRDKKHKLTRWVISWEEGGEGYVVGLTYRQEGVRDSSGGYGPDGDYPEFYLDVFSRVPLYQIKQRLTGKTILVPVESAEPIDSQEE